MRILMLQIVAVLLIIFLAYYFFLDTKKTDDGTNLISSRTEEMDRKPVFSDSFKTADFIPESTQSAKGKSEFWWISSGGGMTISDGTAKTFFGKLSSKSEWYSIYKKNNPRDTDNGYYPQNIFRLVQKQKWKNLRQEVYYKINKDNFSGSEYRNDSNGLLLFNRYSDEYNLYYTGIRVDGFAVIKKKIEGKYFTLAYNKIFDGQYDREKSPSLLPHDQWIGLRSEVEDIDDNSVSVKLFIDRERNGKWELVAEAIDEGKKYGKKPFFEAGHGGIRTDFMDVEFDDYKIEEL